MATTQIQQETKQETLSLDQVDWKPNYKLNKASLGQIMKTFANINITSKNKYEEVLQQNLMPLIADLVKDFNKLLICEGDCDKEVLYHNLLVNLPFYVQIYSDEHKYVSLKYANIGNLLKALYQRISFILERNVPHMYLHLPNHLDCFEKMKENLKNFGNTVIEFEKNFVKIINEAKKMRN